MMINRSLVGQSMECPVCAAKNQDAASQCAACHTPLPVSSLLETLNEAGVPEAWSAAVTPQSAGIVAQGDDLEKGTVFAERYEILQLTRPHCCAEAHPARTRKKPTNPKTFQAGTDSCASGHA